MQRELSLIYVATTLLLLPLSYNFVLKRNLLLDIKNNYKSLLLALVAGVVWAIFSVQTGLGYILASTPELIYKFPSMLMILPFSLGYLLLHDLLPPTKIDQYYQLIYGTSDLISVLIFFAVIRLISRLRQ